MNVVLIPVTDDPRAFTQMIHYLYVKYLDLKSLDVATAWNLV